MVDYVRSEFESVSLRQACLIFNLSTSVYRYTAKKKQDDEIIHQELVTLAEKRPTWGFWKMYYRIRLDGWKINHKRIYRLYQEARLNMRRKTRKRVPKRIKQPLLQPLQPNLSWSMDFMRDSLFMGRPFRAFNVIDDYNREALNITLAKSITSKKVIEELEQLIQWRGKPERIRVDNGPEFIAEALREWCENENRKIELVFIEKGKPSQNGYIERFNKTYREDVLDAYLFEEIEYARELTKKWIWFYNNIRPHESLNNLPPRLFLLKYGKLHYPQIHDEFPTFQQDNIIKQKESLSLHVAK
jgi:putative transposase